MTPAPSSLFLHGGNLDEAARYYGHQPDEMTDLSTGISPICYPLLASQFDVADCQPLPRSSDEERLMLVARRAYCVSRSAGLCLGSGSQSLLRAVPRLIEKPCRVWIPEPTYSEHALAWHKADHQVIHSNQMPQNAVCAVLVNPNNPDGRLHDDKMLKELCINLAEKGGFLLLDEAFIDCDPELSLMPFVGQKGLIILRSLGKFFGLAGLRVGFAAGHPEDIEKLRYDIGPWPVATPSLLAATCALDDQKWIASHRQELAILSQQMRDLLEAYRLDIVGQTGLFVTVCDDDALALHERLAFDGMWARAFSDAPTWIRFGLTADKAVFQKLEACLIKWRR